MPQQFIDLRLPKQQNGKPNDKLDDLAKYLTQNLRSLIDSRQVQIEEKMTRWENNYMGKPKVSVRTTPFYNASNFVSGMIRMHTDIYHARLMGFTFGVKPFWYPTYFTSSVKHDYVASLADWMEYTCFNRMHYFEPIDTAFHSLVKLGTVVLKAPWVERELWSATREANGQGETSSQTFNNVCVSPIHFSDFMCYPINSRTLAEAQIKYHRLRFTEQEVRWRQVNRGWDKEATDALLSSPVTINSSNDAAQADRSGIQLTPDIVRPFQVIECHLDYDFEGNGRLTPIVVLLNPMLNSGRAVLRAYYKTYSELDLDEFIDFHYTSKENSFWKEGIPQILEGHFEEHTQLHCDRRDSSTIANIPTFKKKRLANVANPTDEWYPGKVWELDNMQDIDVLNAGVKYESMMQEEEMIMAQAERLVGNPPPTQGMGSGSMGKRGTYNTGGTLALLGEGNRRLDVMLMRVRHPFHKLGRLIHVSYRDFGDEQSLYPAKEGNDALLRQLLSARPPGGKSPALWYGLNASNASANREVDRTSLLMAAQTLASYYNQLFQVMQAVMGSGGPETPLGKLGMVVLNGARNLADQVLRAFNVQDRPELVPDLQKVLGGQQPQGGPPPPGGEGLAPPEAPVSGGDLQTLSGTIAQIAAAGRGGNNGAAPRGPQ